MAKSLKNQDAKTAAGPDVYERANTAIHDLMDELCDAMQVTNTEPYKRKGYEMVGHYFQQPVNTGELTLVFASVLQDVLTKLEMTQQSEEISMIRDPYTMMKLEE
ncbi:hypothetical protein [Brevibacillus migulae]|uniref:hypothetical protein n=1 Tax=Brevibacillus migulae TaxID=1644114 RepID=UPI00106E4132|nr:hypothetical protein [Brevibacillus migulae]